MQQRQGGCQSLRSKVLSPAVAFTSKTPSSMFSRTRRRYLLPCLRSGLTLESLKWAGTITNVSLTSSPRYVSAIPFSTGSAPRPPLGTRDLRQHVRRIQHQLLILRVSHRWFLSWRSAGALLAYAPVTRCTRDGDDHANIDVRKSVRLYP